MLYEVAPELYPVFVWIFEIEMNIYFLFLSMTSYYYFFYSFNVYLQMLDLNLVIYRPIYIKLVAMVTKCFSFGK
jgi:hypothetical protein